MFLVAKDKKIINQNGTSFEAAYQSLFKKYIHPSFLFQFFSNQKPCWVKFEPSSLENIHDINSTSLIFISLIHHQLIHHDFAKIFINEVLSKPRNEQGLIETSDGQYDYLINFHFLCLLHMVNIQDEKIENNILWWLSQQNIATSEFHNVSFILFSIQKLYKYFKETLFKQKINEILQSHILQHKIPNQLEDFKESLFNKNENYFYINKPILLIKMKITFI